MPWHELPDTAEEWFELYKLPLPREDNPNPELKRFLEKDANGEMQFKPGGPGDLSPGFGGWSWYYVVRFLFEDSSPGGDCGSVRTERPRRCHAGGLSGCALCR